LLCRLGFVPEAGLAHLVFNGADFFVFAFVVKDCLASARLVVESVRRDCRVLSPSVFQIRLTGENRWWHRQVFGRRLHSRRIGAEVKRVRL
jgi:hypothetical protein